MIEIKKLPIDRWGDYKELRLEALKSEPVAFGSAYEEEFPKPKEFWQDRIKNALFALENDKPIGIVVYVFDNQIKTRHIAHIYSMYVSKAYRNQGVGMNLMDSAISRIKENNEIRKIKLTVTADQQFAMMLYKQCGFENTGVFKNELHFGGKYYDEYLMEKYI